MAISTRLLMLIKNIYT